jgi:glycosylphosphatidylinositol transamidase (GPIT) subunit GPI8
LVAQTVALDETMIKGFRIGNDIKGAVVDEFKKYPDTFLEKLNKTTKLRITDLRAEI